MLDCRLASSLYGINIDMYSNQFWQIRYSKFRLGGLLIWYGFGVSEYMNFFLDKKGNHYVSTPTITRHVLINNMTSRQRSETNEKMPLRTPARSSHKKNYGVSFHFINAFSSRPFLFPHTDGKHAHPQLIELYWWPFITEHFILL